MPKLTAVTIGTDGNVDYLETPDGVRYALGTTSVLQLVSQLVSGQRHRREAVEAYNKGGEAMVLVDLEAFFDLQAPKRARWSSTNFDRWKSVNSLDVYDYERQGDRCRDGVVSVGEKGPSTRTPRPRTG